LVIIAPSLLAADITQLGTQVKELKDGGADWLHIDIMDGHFVPNISFGVSFVKAINQISELPLDVHLMIENADLFLTEFRNAGADIITVQYEACPHLWRTVESIKKLGAKAGIAINPATNIDVLHNILEIADLILVMTVEPGFGGQAFIQQTLPKIHDLKKQMQDRKLQFLIEVDGGIDSTTAGSVCKAGAEVLVSGTGILGKKNFSLAINELRETAVKKENT